MATATVKEPKEFIPKGEPVVDGRGPKVDPDAAYLDERGWRDNRDGTWSLMTPPPDRRVEVSRIPQKDGSTKLVEQVLAGPSVGTTMTLAQALVMERKFHREPIPRYATFLSRPLTGHGEKWLIRDRQKSVIDAGPFDFEREAKEWIAHNG